MLEGNFISRVIEPGGVAEFESLLEPLVSSRTSLSEEETADVVWFIREYKSDVFRLLPETIAFREIRAQVGGALIRYVASDARVDAFLQRNVETATDVLRLAVALSGGDVSLTTATTHFKAMKRSMRRLLLRLLDNIPNAAEDVMRHAERWKRLAEVLHPGDYGDKYPQALAVITAARRNEPPITFNSRVERLLAQRDGSRLGTRRVRGGCRTGVLACPVAGTGPGSRPAPLAPAGVHTERFIRQSLCHQGSTRTSHT
jgi:hypothetical protein